MIEVFLQLIRQKKKQDIATSADQCTVKSSWGFYKSNKDVGRIFPMLSKIPSKRELKMFSLCILGLLLPVRYV
jgi:hypothetical protein